MLSLAPLASLSLVAPLAPAMRMGAQPVMRETAEDLVGLAESLNPNIGFWDPLGLAKRDFWDQGNEATIGFLRHAEIKHGRVAMAGFVGYCVQANGIYWPWPLANPGQEDEITHAMISAAGSPPEQWDALPTSAKVQIILFLAIIEYCGEQGKPHYMRGGKPGAFPKLTENKGIPHPVPLNLYDPFGWSANMDEATKERRLLMEINNGELPWPGRAAPGMLHRRAVVIEGRALITTT